MPRPRYSVSCHGQYMPGNQCKCLHADAFIHDPNLMQAYKYFRTRQDEGTWRPLSRLQVYSSQREIHRLYLPVSAEAEDCALWYFVVPVEEVKSASFLYRLP